MRKKILLIGPFPPPTGGVSIHLQRLTRLLKDDFEFDFVDEARLIKTDYFNLRNLRLFQYFKKIKNSDLLYVHSGTDFLKILHIITGKLFCKRIILTIHAYPERKRVLSRSKDQIFYRLANRIIAVNPEILDRITLPSRKCSVMNAFLPPVMEVEPDLPAKIEDWILQQKREGRVIVCSNAYRLEIFNDQDLYGLDLCIEAAIKLARDLYPFSFIFNISVLDDYKNKYERYHTIIKELKLQDCFLLINENLSFVRLIEQSDIVLRPTNTDGDALTVREALYLGKTVIASDVVQRPEGTILFKSRDVNDLILKLTEISYPDKKVSGNKGNETENMFRMFYSDLIIKTLTRQDTPGE